jgi:hypothetical protein
MSINGKKTMKKRIIQALLIDQISIINFFILVKNIIKLNKNINQKKIEVNLNLEVEKKKNIKINHFRNQALNLKKILKKIKIKTPTITKKFIKISKKKVKAPKNNLPKPKEPKSLP